MIVTSDEDLRHPVREAAEAFFDARREMFVNHAMQAVRDEAHNRYAARCHQGVMIELVDNYTEERGLF